MNSRETGESVLRALMFTLWNVCTFFLPAFIVLFWQPNLTGGLLAVLVLGVGLAAFPIWRKLHFDFLASTTWANQRGVSAEMLRAREEAGALSIGFRAASGIGLVGALVTADSSSRMAPEGSP